MLMLSIFVYNFVSLNGLFIVIICNVRFTVLARSWQVHRLKKQLLRMKSSQSFGATFVQKMCNSI